MKVRAFIAALALTAAPPTAAQEPFDDKKFIRETFEAAYALWGVMRVVESECTTLTGDPAYTQAIGKWHIANAPARAEIDTAYAATDADPAPPSESEKVGEEMMRNQLTISANPQAACDNFLQHVLAGDYDAYDFISYQFAILRDYGLLPKATTP